MLCCHNPQSRSRIPYIPVGFPPAAACRWRSRRSLAAHGSPKRFQLNINKVFFKRKPHIPTMSSKWVYANFDFVSPTFPTALSPLGYTVYILHPPSRSVLSPTQHTQHGAVRRVHSAAALLRHGVGGYLELRKEFVVGGEGRTLKCVITALTGPHV